MTAKGYAVWDAGNGIVDCNYEAHIVLGPADGIRENDVLKQKQLLTRNPYVSKDTIHDLFAKRLCRYLDDEFEEALTVAVAAKASRRPEGPKPGMVFCGSII